MATEQDTNDNLRKPFQVGRGVMTLLHHANNADELAGY